MGLVKGVCEYQNLCVKVLSAYLRQESLAAQIGLGLAETEDGFEPLIHFLLPLEWLSFSHAPHDLYGARG